MVSLEESLNLSQVKVCYEFLSHFGLELELTVRFEFRLWQNLFS